MRINRQSKYKQPGVKGFLHWWIDNPNNPLNFNVLIIINVIIILSIIFTILDFYNFNVQFQYYLSLINNIFLFLFIFEYLIRFYMSTDFICDAKEENLCYAIKNKIKWFFSFYSIIDFIAILPILRFLRIFRTLKLLRLLKFFRFFRVIKLFRNFGKMILFLKTLTSDLRFLLVLFSTSIIILVSLSFGLFSFERITNNTNYESFLKSFLYSLINMGVYDDNPETIGGKIFGSLILLSNILIFSFLISILTNRMGEIMDDIKKGKVGKLSLKNHVVFCGYTSTTQRVIDILVKSKEYYGKMVLLTIQDNIDLDGVIFVNADPSKRKSLDLANIKDAETAVVFAEKGSPEEKSEITDLRTSMTVYQIEQEFPLIHTIAEIYEEDSAAVIVNQIKGDEIIYKELIDANLIVNSIKFRNISPILYELTDSTGRKIENINNLRKLKQLGIELPMLVKEIKIRSSEYDFTFLGIITENGKPILAPDLDFEVKENDSIIVLI